MKRSKDDFFYRSFALDRAKVDEKTRSVPVSFSSETPVKRYFGDEYLLHGKNNVDLTRLKSMGAVLMNHDAGSIVGPIRNPKIEDRRGTATVVFDDDDDGNKAMKKVQSGSLKGVSVAYRIQKFRELARGEEWEDDEGRKFRGPAFIATRWTPFEISLTPIPADASVGVGRSENLEGIEIERSETLNKGGQEMTEEEIRKMLEGFRGGIIQDVLGAIQEGQRPKMTVTVDQSKDLLGRAGAVSVECKSKVADQIMDGKTEPEILRFIGDEMHQADGGAKPGDASDKGDGGNPDDGNRGNGFQVKYRNAAEMPDDDFARMISSPAMLPAFN